MIDIGVALGTLKTITGVMKDAGRIDLTQQVIELQQTLIALLGENTELAGHKHELEKRLRELDSTLDQKEEFVFDRDAYWRVDGDSTVGPFCSKCFDVDSKTVRMHKAQSGYSMCPNCKTLAEVNPEQRAATTLPRQQYRRSWVMDY